MRNDKTYLFHSDSGHGWLQVERNELEDLGIDKKITMYSYQHGRDVYLEEDMDMLTFIKAYDYRFGKRPLILQQRESDEWSSIRYFDMYKPTKKSLNYTKCYLEDVNE